MLSIVLRAAGTTAAAIGGALLVSLLKVEFVPGAAVVALLAAAAFAAWRPAQALFGLALLLPLARWLGREWQYQVAWPEALAVAAIAGLGLRFARGGTRLWSPVSLSATALTLVVVASLLVRLAVLHGTIGGDALAQHLRQLVGADYFLHDGGFSDVDAAARLLEGLALLVAASAAACRSSRFSERLVQCIVAGAALSSAANLWRLWQSALRGDDPLVTFAGYLASLRYNIHFADVNAAGSYYVMALLPAVALAIGASQRRVLWIAAALTITSSLVLSGSRTALAAGLLAGAVWGGQRAVATVRTTGRGRWLAGALLLSTAALGVAYLAASRNQVSSSTALELRQEFARTSLRMLATRPLFGVGIGQYAHLSDSHTSERRFALFRARRENAHNNFLQVLAELGVAGFAAFLWVLAAGGVSVARQLRTGSVPIQQGAILQGATAGLVAFVLTWLAGHPLLIDESALMFWLLLGAVAGSDGARPQRAHGSWRAGAAVAAVALLAASIPLRAARERADANLEHRGIGLSGWHRDEQSRLYRVAGTASTVFLPSGARLVTVPLRAVEEPLDVALHLNGRRANVVRVPPDGWLMLPIVLPEAAEAPRFHRLDLRVIGRDGNALLLVGRVEPR